MNIGGAFENRMVRVKSCVIKLAVLKTLVTFHYTSLLHRDSEFF